MGGISTEIIDVIYQLLPGFVVAWVFYGLTAYIKPAPFERIVQALIFTVIVRVILILSKLLLFEIGKLYSIGQWTENIEFIFSIILAIFFGLFISWCANNDFPFYLFRKDENVAKSTISKWLNKSLSKLKLTEKTLHPSEWYSSFCSNERYVVLYLKGGLRLYGWPKQYPDGPDIGHFIITEPEWLLDDGTSAPLHNVEEMLVGTSEIERVDFLKMPSEVNTDKKDLDKIKKKLIAIQNKEK